MQCTTPSGLLTAWKRPGLATDAALAALADACGPVLAVRVILPVDGGCCDGTSGAGPTLVALDPADKALPESQRAPVGLVQPGHAVADTAWAVLAGGTIALAGTDIVVAGVAAIGPVGDAAPVLLALSDLASSLRHTKPDFAPSMRTVAVTGCRVGADHADGWHLLGTRAGGVGVSTGIGGRCEHSVGQMVPA